MFVVFGCVWVLISCRVENLYCFGTAQLKAIFFHLAILRYQNIKMSTYILNKNGWVLSFSSPLVPVREKLKNTVTWITLYVSKSCDFCDHRINSVLNPTSSECVTFCDIFQAGMASIVFDETEIVLNPTCALFVTMEAPRAIHRKIPDNFKVVTCMVLMWIMEFVLFMVIKMMMISLFRCFSEVLPCPDRIPR